MHRRQRHVHVHVCTSFLSSLGCDYCDFNYACNETELGTRGDDWGTNYQMHLAPILPSFLDAILLGSVLRRPILSSAATN